MDRPRSADVNSDTGNPNGGDGIEGTEALLARAWTDRPTTSDQTTSGEGVSPRPGRPFRHDPVGPDTRSIAPTFRSEMARTYGAAVVGGAVVGVLEDDDDPVPEPAPLLLSTVTLDTFQPDPVKVRSVWIWSSSADGDVILLLT